MVGRGQLAVRSAQRRHGSSTRASAGAGAGTVAPAPPSQHHVQEMEAYDYLVGMDPRFSVLQRCAVSSLAVRNYIREEVWRGEPQRTVIDRVIQDLRATADPQLTARPRRGRVRQV